MYSVMGGKVLEHESKTIFNEGRKEGREEGREEERRVLVMRMHKEGYKEKEIAKLVGESL